MNEKDKIKRAQYYMIKLAQGINPLTNENFEEDTVLNDVRFSRCFNYISDILEKVIQNDGFGGKNSENLYLHFSSSSDILNTIQLSQKPISISEFSNNINQTLEKNYIKKISIRMITWWLVKNGYLKVISLPDGKTTKGVTEKSFEIGITSEERSTEYRVYNIILYSKQAQEFIISNLKTIVSEYQAEKKANKKTKKIKKSAWSIQEEKQLLLENSNGLSMQEIAKRHNRDIKDIENKLLILKKI